MPLTCSSSLSVQDHESSFQHLRTEESFRKGAAPEKKNNVTEASSGSIAVRNHLNTALYIFQKSPKTLRCQKSPKQVIYQKSPKHSLRV
jgi:hypothetical protein